MSILIEVISYFIGLDFAALNLGIVGLDGLNCVGSLEKWPTTQALQPASVVDHLVSEQGRPPSVLSW